MFTQIEIISGQILTLLESKKDAVAFQETKESMPDESVILIHISLHWLVQGGFITENVLTNEFNIMDDELAGVLSARNRA